MHKVEINELIEAFIERSKLSEKESKELINLLKIFETSTKEWTIERSISALEKLK